MDSILETRECLIGAWYPLWEALTQPKQHWEEKLEKWAKNPPSDTNIKETENKHTKDSYWVTIQDDYS